MAIQPAGNFTPIRSGDLEARVYRDSGHLQLAGPDPAGNPLANLVTFAPVEVKLSGATKTLGRVVSSVAIPDGLELRQMLGATQVITRMSFPTTGVMRYEVIDWGGKTPASFTVIGASDGDEHFYGFGEKFNAFDQAGKKVEIITFDPPGNKGDRSYKAVPWFISTRGYGFHFDFAVKSTFDMGAPDQYKIQGAFPKRKAGGATISFLQLRFNLVYGPKLSDVLIRYTGLTGRPSLPPPWAFGPWISSDVWRNGGEVDYAVEKFRGCGIPASAFVFDSPWETAYNDFAFNKTQFGKEGTFEGQEHDGFASAAKMMEFLQQQGLKVLCWMTPFINDQSNQGEVAGQLAKASNYDDAVKKGVFVRDSTNKPLLIRWWKGRGSPVDFTSPTATTWLTDQLKKLLGESEVVTQSGAKEPVIGGFKTDDGEARTDQGSATTPGGVYIPPTAIYADGRTGEEMRNAYCLEYLKAVASVLGTNGLIFARSGFAGTQAFPACWAGDNEPNFGNENGLASVIVAGQSAAMSGFSIWGHDIGGYQNNNFSTVSRANLFIRWTQFGCFTPIMQMHRQVDGNNLQQYPWGYPAAGEDLNTNTALNNFKFYASLHTQLFPYIFTYAKESSINGLPIIRPLVLLHQDDPKTYGIRHTYYFGNEFIAAPVVKPTAAGAVTERTVYLPEGSWRDFWSQELHAGKREILWRNANQQQFPLFVREGAIVPMLLNVPQTLCDANYVNNPAIKTPDDGLQFLVYPSGTSSFTVHDGTLLTSHVNGATTSLTLTSVARPIELKVFGQRPTGVIRDGVALTEHATQPSFDAALTGWRHKLGFILVKFQHIGGSTQITF